MATLFSYCIPVDDGAAPNPFWGTCTLVICKPAIRRVAEVGDWIAGTGSVNSPIGNIAGHVVYAMQVTDKMKMRDYDRFCAASLPQKIPIWRSKDVRLRLGDAIYDYSTDPPGQREGVHGPLNRDRDLGGRFALISRHFYYFGDHPVLMPRRLLPIVKQGSGHRSKANAPYFQSFLTWLLGLGLEPGMLYGAPQRRLFRGHILIGNTAEPC